MQLKDYKIKIRSILKVYPQARDNDGTLLAYFITTYLSHLVTRDVDGDLSIKLKNLKNLPPIETIRRSRQIIQNVDGEFLPTDPKVIKARRIKEQNYKNAEVREASWTNKLY